MSHFLQELALYTLIIAAAFFLGGFLPIVKHWERHRMPVLLSFAGGLLLGAFFFHLLPESFELLNNIFSVSLYTLLGFSFLFLVERFVTVHVCEIFDCEVHELSVSAILGIGLHTLVNGIALGSSLMVENPGVSLGIFLAIAAHKGPEIFSLNTLLIHNHVRKSKIILANVALLMLIPVGALLAYFFLNAEGGTWMGRTLAFSAGTFLHISLSDLLPEAHRHSNSKLKTALTFLLGLGVMWFLAKQFHVHG